jgi:VCBS repeat-containing protein
LWRLIAPTATTGTVDVTWAGAQDERLVIAISVKDANQATPETTPVIANSDVEPFSQLSVTATGLSAGQLVIDGQFFLDAAGGSNTFTADGSQSSKQEIEGGDTLYEGLGVSTLTSGGTSQVMSWTLASSITTASSGWGSYGFGVNGV